MFLKHSRERSSLQILQFGKITIQNILRTIKWYIQENIKEGDENKREMYVIPSHLKFPEFVDTIISPLRDRTAFTKS